MKMKSAPMPKNELGKPKRPFSETFSAFTAIREHFAPPKPPHMQQNGVKDD